ncbi:invasion associated locus B family protein [Sedimentitalea sp. HM32M-2]|uniref:invasion associated locus B family protein n=1 Tax=Sedimentitalea sp. HM32M-2 TaxID=3351566 RepID=UPI0036427B9B
MFKHLPSLAALSLVALTVQAQAEDKPAATPETEAQAAETAEKPALDLGQPVDQGPKLGERYSKEKHGDWDLACIKTEAETDPCSLLQILTDDTGNPVAEVSLFRIENGSQAAAGATVLVPLETLLPAQLTIAVDDNPGKRYQYSFCSPIGCAAQIGLTKEDVEAFKKGGKATVSLVPAPAPDQVVKLTLSLSGFTAGFAAVDVLTE